MKLTQKEFNAATDSFVGQLTGRFNDLSRVKKLMHAYTIARILAGEQNVIPAESYRDVESLEEGSKAQAILTGFLIPPYEGARKFSRVFGSLKNAKRCQQAFIQAFVKALKRESEWAIHDGIKIINKAWDGSAGEYKVPKYVDQFGDEKRTRYDNSVRIRDDVFWLHFDPYHIEQGTVRLLDLSKKFETCKDVYENFAHKVTFSNFLTKDGAKRVIRKCIVRMADLAVNEENLMYTINALTSFSEKDTMKTPRRKILLKLLRL